MLESGERGRGSNRVDVAEICRSEDRDLMLVGNIQVANAAVRHRASHEGNFVRTGKAEVSDVLAAPAQKSVILLARNGSPDPLARHA